MKYETYQNIKDYEKYFSSWDSSELERLDTEIRKQIYEKYVMKCNILQRDNFTCQNKDCKHPNIRLTIHHIKFQKNGGENKVRNGVTLCNTCHQGYHRAKRPLVFLDIKSLPTHLRGHTFRLHKAEKVDWKLNKSKMRELRKTLKSDHGIRISWKTLSILMRLLDMPLEKWDD